MILVDDLDARKKELLQEVLDRAPALAPIDAWLIWHLAARLREDGALACNRPRRRFISDLPDSAPIRRAEVRRQAELIRSTGKVPCLVTCIFGSGGASTAWGGMAAAPARAHG